MMVELWLLSWGGGAFNIIIGIYLYLFGLGKSLKYLKAKKCSFTFHKYLLKNHCVENSIIFLKMASKQAKCILLHKKKKKELVVGRLVHFTDNHNIRNMARSLTREAQRYIGGRIRKSFFQDEYLRQISEDFKSWWEVEKSGIFQVQVVIYTN